ncbi:unnamed protein product, partial [marine sediment metagenome]
LITVQQSEGAILIGIGIFVGGFIIGWFMTSGHDSSSPDAQVISEENYILTWNDFIEGWNNDYISGNTNLANYMMMYNLTYLDSVRRAEHDVASYVHLTNWSDVQTNMTSLVDYKENITKFIISTLHGYNRVEVSILQHMYDTDSWSYTTPMKIGKHYITGDQYAWMDLELYGSQSFPPNYNVPTQYKVCFGTHPVGYNGDYDIGDKLYVTFMYVPNGNSITLKNLNSDEETVYTQGVHDLEGLLNEVIDVTIRDSGLPSYDNT